MIIYNPDLKIFYSNKINDSSYFSAFGTRELGDGRNTENISSFLDENEIRYTTIVVPDQIHSSNIAFIEEQEPGIEKIEDTDGVLTNKKDTVLTVIAADCLPIVFVDKEKGIVGISHHGWRGSLKRLAQKMIERIVKAGGSKEDIIVAIGPGIGACCYDIDDDRYQQFFEEFDGYSDKIFSQQHGRRHVDLSLLNYLLLVDVGVKKENIDFFPFCTSCDKKRFFSARRMKKPNFDRQFSLIVRL